MLPVAAAARLNFDDLQSECSYSGQRAHGQFKLANVVENELLAGEMESAGVPGVAGPLRVHLRLEFHDEGNGKMRLGGQHIVLPERTPIANLHLTLLQKVGVERDTFGDSTGTIADL